MASPGANQRGIIAIVGCMASYSCNDALMKQILTRHPVGEAIFIRGVFTVLLLGLVVVALGHARRLWPSMTPQLAGRSLFDGISTAFFIAALSQLAMANVAAILQIAPLIITALSVLIYREQVGMRRWTAVLVGLVGALLVVKPVPSAFNLFALVAIGSALASAGREILNRQIESDVPTLVIAFWGAVAITAVGGLFIVGEQWHAVPLRDVGMIGIAACFMTVAIYLMARGFRDVDLSVVVPFRYTYLLTSAIAGFLVFGEIPDTLSGIGAVLIVGAGLYMLHREAVRRRAITAASVPAA